MTIVYQSQVSFSSIIVIESLDSESQRTGTDLFETTIAPAADAHGMLAELYRIKTAREFIAVLKHVSALARAGHAPIVHFEMHGDEEGLQLASLEMIQLAELALLLTEINQACAMNLLVVAAACNGWYLGSVLHPIDRAPMWGVIGPPATQRAGNLYAAMRVFYDRLLSDFDLVTALRSMNGNRSVDEWDYDLTSAELLFCRVFQYYMDSTIHDESPAQRLNRLVAEAARHRTLDVNATMMLREELRSKLADHKFWFEHYRKTFLMLDLFPNNAGRFQFSFERCIESAERRATARSSDSSLAS